MDGLDDLLSDDLNSDNSVSCTSSDSSSSSSSCDLSLGDMVEKAVVQPPMSMRGDNDSGVV